MIKSISLNFEPEEEPMVRRLGCAVTYHWDRLPDELKGLFLEQAVFTRDEPTTQLKEQLSAFIRKYKAEGKDTI